ncbi:MAG: anti-sigma factor family protein [Terriglobales bacterium]
MSCGRVRRQLSAFLDGELPLAQRCALMRHVQDCPECAGRLEAYRSVSQAVGMLVPLAPPAGLALRLRVAGSHAAARQQWLDYWRMRLINSVRAVAVPATAGMMGALCLFAFMYGSVGRTVVANAAVADVPLPLSSPAQMINPANVGVSAPLLVLANIDAQGQADGYRILSGPRTPTVIAQLNDALLLSEFQPAEVLGERVAGQVLIRYSTVDVRGRD